MAKARKPSALKDALTRLMELATKGARPQRVAMAVEQIADEWRRSGDEPEEVEERLQELHAQIAEGVLAVEEQLSEVDQGEKAAVRQGQAALAALMAGREATQRAMARASG